MALKITTDDVMRLGPCPEWSRCRVHKYLGDKGKTPSEIAKLSISQSAVLWLMIGLATARDNVMAIAASIERMDDIRHQADLIRSIRCVVIDQGPDIPYTDKYNGTVIFDALNAVSHICRDRPDLALHNVFHAIMGITELCSAERRSIIEDLVRLVEERDDNE